MLLFFTVAIALVGLASGFGPGGRGPRDLKGIGHLPLSATQLPSAPARYQMNQSTIIMPCNNSGYTDPASTVGWSIIDFDWSNGKAIWTKQRPMMDEAASRPRTKRRSLDEFATPSIARRYKLSWTSLRPPRTAR